MKNAIRATVATFGVINFIAAFEHGLGEMLQGSTAPESIFILSWPGSAFFQIHGGEPAMTLIPNLLISGILTIIFALFFLAWSTVWSSQRQAGPALLLLSLILLLVGGGFGPPLLGLILGTSLTVSATRQGKSSARPAGWRRFLGGLWLGLFIAAVTAWLMVFPGLNLLNYALRLVLPDALVYTVIFSALGLLVLALWAASARDRAGFPERVDDRGSVQRAAA